MTVSLADLNEAANALYNLGEKRLCATVRAAEAEIASLRDQVEGQNVGQAHPTSEPTSPRRWQTVKIPPTASV